MATAIPAAVAMSASEIAGATTLSDALVCAPSFVNVSKIPITVPNNPMKGAVDEIIDSKVKPFVDERTISDDAALNIALFGLFTRDR